MKFLLDTNILSEPLKPKPDTGVLDHLEQAGIDQCAVSVLSIQEMRYGTKLKRLKHPGSRDRWPDVEKWLLRFTFLDFNRADAILAGDMEAHLHETGCRMEASDLFIGASAMAHNLILVTRNTKHFQALVDRGLKLENWFES